VGSEYETRRNQCFQGAEILHNRFPEVLTLRDGDLRQLGECKGEMEDDVFKRCTFIIEENQRVLEASSAILLGTEESGGRLGDLFNASFRGARDLYEITVPEMERMHEAMVSAPGVLASRQAGGGFGGCMSSLVHAPRVEEFSAHVMSAYKQSTGLEPVLYSVSPGDGAGLLPL
jgi:galactokinase